MLHCSSYTFLIPCFIEKIIDGPNIIAKIYNMIKVFMLLNCDVGKTLKNPLDCKEIQPVHSEGDQPWDFFGRNDAKAEAPVLWPPHAKS